jgi:F0F1-type ATP synthase beta subunit
MLTIHKKIVLDEDQKPMAVQIPIEEFEQLENIIENYGLSKLMDEAKNEERLSVENAKKYYQSLKQNVES